MLVEFFSSPAGLNFVHTRTGSAKRIEKECPPFLPVCHIRAKDMSMQPMTQEDLMKAALKHQAALVAYAYGWVRDYHLADDVVQEALLVMMKKWTDFQPGTSVFAFARAIVRFKALEAVRARARREVTLEDEQLQAAIDKTLDEQLDEDSSDVQSRMVHALQECLERLTRRAADLVTGFYRDNKSYRELSQIHSLNMEALKKALYRHRRTLEQCAERKVREWEAVG